MKKRAKVYWGAAVILGIGFVLAESPAVLLRPSESREILQVTATVPPTRVIIVDKDLIIQQIYSNTPTDVRPEVHLGDAGGPAEPYPGTVEDQYAQLRPRLDFTKAGIVYGRPTNPFVSFFRSIWETITGWF